MQIALSCVFGLDIIISFFVGFYDTHGLLVMQNLPVAANYIRWAMPRLARKHSIWSNSLHASVLDRHKTARISSDCLCGRHMM